MQTSLNALPASRWRRFLANAKAFEEALEYDRASYLEQRVGYLERRIAELEAQSGTVDIRSSTRD